MELDPYLAQSGGVARIRDLRNAGHTRAAIDAAVRDRLLRPARGLVALPQHRPDVLAALRNNGVLTCASAAADYGLWIGRAPSGLHLRCDHGRARGVRVHRGPVRTAPGRLPLADIRTVVRDALGCLDELDAVAMAESAIRIYGLRREEIEEGLHARNQGHLRRRLDLATLRADSYPEIAARLLLLHHRIPFEEQAHIPGIGRVDFLVCGVLILEVDGLAYHASREAKRRDDRRNNAAAAQGYATLRFLPEYFTNRPEVVLAAVRDTLAAQGVLRPGESFA